MPIQRKQNNITFFSPSMKRTGSEIVLFNLLSKLSPKFHAKLITKYKGELSLMLPVQIKSEYLYKTPSVNLYSRIRNRIYRQLFLQTKLSKHINSVWYINTISLPDIVKYAEHHKIKTILHLHELEQRFSFLNELEIKQLVNYPFLIIANSNTSKKVLDAYGRKKNIEICYPAIDTKSIIKNKQVYYNYRKKLNITSNSFLWVMCGTLDENKNPFLFIEIAAEVCKSQPNTLFMWIGSTPEMAIMESCQKKTNELSLTNKIIWQTNDPDNYYNYFNCADGFVLTSIKESFSLVTIEALILELPIVAQNCGGVKEILGNDIGTIVEEINNPKKMAEEIIKFMSGLHIIDIEKGKQRAYEFDIVKGAKKWNNILINYLQ
jgi:glycosyltransferase involved in cell wall biosynthesis